MNIHYWMKILFSSNNVLSLKEYLTLVVPLTFISELPVFAGRDYKIICYLA